MTVSELIGYVEELDGDAEVRIMMQESWPFECAIRGVVTRDQLGNDECDCDHRIGEPHDEECMAFGEGEGEYEDGLRANDCSSSKAGRSDTAASELGNWSERPTPKDSFSARNSRALLLSARRAFSPKGGRARLKRLVRMRRVAGRRGHSEEGGPGFLFGLLSLLRFRRNLRLVGLA
jgi:hypothetical protein